MECFIQILRDNIGLIIALIALFVAYISLRSSIVNTALSTVTQKANNCNRYLTGKSFTNHIESIRIAEEICTTQTIIERFGKQYRFLLNKKQRYFIKVNFYLQINQLIKDWLMDKESLENFRTTGTTKQELGISFLEFKVMFLVAQDFLSGIKTSEEKKISKGLKNANLEEFKHDGF
jgi:hypothetical protein